MPEASPASPAPSSIASRLERALFSRRRAALAAFALITLAMGWLASGLRVDAGFSKLVPLKHEYMRAFLEHRAEFGGADRVAVALVAREGDIFTPGFFAALRKATDAVFFLPGVDRAQVYSILTPNVRFTEVVEDGIVGGNVLPADFRPTKAGLARVRENVIKAGVVGRLVANDFTGALVSARLQEFHPGTGERLDYLRVARALEEIRRDIRAGGAAEAHVIGFAKAVGEIAAGASRVLMFFAAAVAVTALFVWVWARSLRLTALLLGCSLVAVVWQLGALSGLGFGVDPMSILVPFLVFAIGVSHGVQMVGAVRLEGGGRDAARRSFRRLLLPGTAALASDAVGFVAIALIEVRVIQEIAAAASLGVAAIILTNLGLLPVALSFIEGEEARSPAPARRPAAPWRLAARLARRGPAAVALAAAAALLALGALYAPRVRVGDQRPGVPELRASAAYNVDSAVIAERFDIGVNVLTVIAETRPQGCVEHEVMRVLDDFEWRMRGVAGVRSLSGLAGVVRKLNAGWNEGSLKWRVLPRDGRALAQSVALVPTSSGLLNADCSAMPVMIYAADRRAETIRRVVAAVKAFQEEKRGAPVAFRLAAGNLGVMAATNEEIEAAQFPILGYVYAAVVLLCLLSFRSAMATLCIVLPLALVSLLAYALMAALEIGLKVSTLPVVALGVGVGVDYGIYICGRLLAHLEEGLDFAAAYERTLSTAGAGVALTGLTLAAGVATWIFAPLKLQADMGTVLSFMFLVNMIGAVALLPALGAFLMRPKARKEAPGA